MKQVHIRDAVGSRRRRLSYGGLLKRPRPLTTSVQTRRLQQTRFRGIKRSIDVSLVICSGWFVLPLVLVIAAVVKWSSSGSVFYVQERIGYGGVPFRMWKFRTMRHDAEELLDEYLRGDPELKRQWDRKRKLRDDPRVVPWIGKFLRRSSLDELPQLWNVLRGDMSLVGPRPLPQYHLDEFDRSFLDRREEVVPGMTGLWQVASRGDGRPKMFVRWDSQYIENWSLWLDLKILLRTALAVASGNESP